jgi:hypothetical protein
LDHQSGDFLSAVAKEAIPSGAAVKRAVSECGDTVCFLGDAIFYIGSCVSIRFGGVDNVGRLEFHNIFWIRGVVSGTFARSRGVLLVVA